MFKAQFSFSNPDQIFEQQGPLGQRKLITSAHTPAANIIGRLRTNFRSFVNRRVSPFISVLIKINM